LKLAIFGGFDFLELTAGAVLARWLVHEL